MRCHFPERLRTPAPGERGSVTLYFLVFGVVMIGILGLLVDGGRLLMASADTDDLAAEAARTAGQEIRGPEAIEGNGTEADPDKAAAAARSFLAQAGVSGTVRVLDGGQKIDVTVHYTYHPLLLGGMGYGDMPVTGHATATLVRTT
ncbi:TadE/TadG family type IV pilus assembly protein [Streptomyces sp. NBC_01500]|uniref:TadE/TadG family type IV pilus assembly protein n=1 Tax=Streptomyces sp. NBC_01500 TaxID=2903886 RepID=UPI00225859E5|nr:pilus assembly protein TadG-related protein [Streptomyces sp. NBC_01500]MCX4554241.1 pilus assembly protein TadG-related protein [Streptomyces sp. NBC_01500]